MLLLCQKYKKSSLSNTVEQIRPVNGLTRLVRPVQVVKQWLTGSTGRGTMVTCISLVRQHFNHDSTNRITRTTRTGRETMVHARVVQLVNCIHIYMLMIDNFVELIRPVNGSRDKHVIVMPQSAKHDEYSSFPKRENEFVFTANLSKLLEHGQPKWSVDRQCCATLAAGGH